MQNNTNAALEVEAYRTYHRVINADESLTASMIDRQTSPESSERIALRAIVKVTSQHFNSTLTHHGVEGEGFDQCADAISTPLLGVSASQVKLERLSRLELVASMFAEEVAIERIKNTKASGNRECVRHSREAGEETKAVITRAVSA